MRIVKIISQKVDRFTHSLNKYNKEPFQRVQDAVEIALIEVLFQLRKEFCENGVVMREEPGEFWKSQNEQSMHGKLKAKYYFQFHDCAMRKFTFLSVKRMFSAQKVSSSPKYISSIPANVLMPWQYPTSLL